MHNTMQVLIDTNVLILREDSRIIDPALQILLKCLHENNIKVLIHPSSKKDLARDKDTARRNVSLSKLGTYATLSNPPKLTDDFYHLLGNPRDENANDQVDNNLLYALYKNAVDFLITEDQGLIKKAKKIGVGKKILTISEAKTTFSTLFKTLPLIHPQALKYIEIYNLNLEDAFFDSLKADYPHFENWWNSISQRKAYVFFQEDESIGALLILKEEDESIDSSNPILPKRKRLKICTLKVTSNGQKIGELFIKKSIEYAIEKDLDEIYLTVFADKQKALISLIEEYGFKKVAIKEGTEEIFLKKLKFLPTEFHLPLSSIFFPYFYDGEEVNKFIIPIQPKFSERLFEGKHDKQLSIQEEENFIIEQNTIKKAYICRSNIKKIKKGDLVFFYRSHDFKSLISVGVVEEVLLKLKDKEEVIKIVGKRTVYSALEIEQIVKRPAMVILFKQYFDIEQKKMITLQQLIELGILNAAPQTITQISDDNYKKILKNKTIDERFTVH